MGGRGITVPNNNTQIGLDQYLLRQEIEQLHATWEAHRQENGEQENTSDSMSAEGSSRNRPRNLLKRCACCRQFTLPAYSEYEVCPICGWIDDPNQNHDPSLLHGANPMSLGEARIIWAEKRANDSK